jgi:hypothetical protein
METVKDRIITYIKYTGISQKKFEETVGISNGYVNNVKASPSSTVLQKIFGAYPGLNKDWLLTGEGPMLTSDLSGSVHQQSSGDNSPNVNGTGNVVGGVGGVAVEDMATALRKALGTIETQSSTISTLTDLVRDLRKQIEEQTKKG